MSNFDQWREDVLKPHPPVTQEAIGKQAALEKARNLINNDAFAASFQTLGQYRTALLAEIK